MLNQYPLSKGFKPELYSNLISSVDVFGAGHNSSFGTPPSSKYPNAVALLCL